MNNLSLFQDWDANRGNPKGRFILIMYRLAVLIRTKKILLIFFFWYLFIYIFLVEWLIGAELTLSAKIGNNTSLWHAHALVINPTTIIGDNCVLRHCTTIGNKGSLGKGPQIGSNVNIGSNVCIIGDITIGDNVTIGAGSVIVKNIPSNCVVVGNPARIVKYN